MINNIELEIAPIDEAITAILDAIGRIFLNHKEAQPYNTDLEKDVASYLEPLREDLYCLIEYPYVDKVYRDSYYSYFASKHSSYHRDCIRVSLFDSEITGDEFLDKDQHYQLNQKYLGFFIIRPTLSAVFGRAIISPRALIDNDFKICLVKSVIFVLGVRFETEGFPHSSQDEETILCAETTIWALMDYFSGKYPEYKPTLPSQIHSALRNIIFQRQLPSMGLSMDQISFALKEFGFGTRIYNKTAYGKEIFNIIDCYIESGIPVLIGLEGKAVGHVIIGIGKQYDTSFTLNDVEKTKFHSHGREKTFIEYTNYHKKIVVQDDNMAPYNIINLNNPGEHYDDEDFKNIEIDSLIVPLYTKIYLEAELARQLFLQIIKDDKVGYDFEDNFIFRYFLASSRSFKNHISMLKDLDVDLKFNVISCKMPKFVWCGEIYSPKTDVNLSAEPIGLLVLDATEANRNGISALIFAGYPDKCINKTENKFISLQHSLKKYQHYSNLK